MHHHGSDTPTSPWAVLHHTDANLCTILHTTVNHNIMRDCSFEFPQKYKFKTCCVQILFWMSKQKQKFCAHVVILFFSWNSMNNLLSYCGLTDARMRAAEKDLPVACAQKKRRKRRWRYSSGVGSRRAWKKCKMKKWRLVERVKRTISLVCKNAVHNEYNIRWLTQGLS